MATEISNSVLKAMVTGSCVVATRVGGNPEIVEDGLTGSLMPLEDHALLSEMITKYMNDRSLCESQRQAGRLRWRKLFSLNVMVEKYYRLYSSMA
jgi:glycosyltransferase involved in cell wall biosynthesis